MRLSTCKELFTYRVLRCMQGIKQLLHPATAAKIVLCGRNDARLPVDMDAAPQPSPAQGPASTSPESPAGEGSGVCGGSDASSGASAPCNPARAEVQGKGGTVRAEVQAAP